MSNLQVIQLSCSLNTPTEIFLTWNIISFENPAYNSYYIIHYNTDTLLTTSMNFRLPVHENTTYTIYITSVDHLGNESSPSNSIQITSSINENVVGLNSGLRPFSRLLPYQLNVERMCDNVPVLLPYPTFININNKPFYQYYKIQNQCQPP
jgi:hypothetical protein